MLMSSDELSYAAECSAPIRLRASVRSEVYCCFDNSRRSKIFTKSFALILLFDFGARSHEKKTRASGDLLPDGVRSKITMIHFLRFECLDETSMTVHDGKSLAYSRPRCMSLSSHSMDWTRSVELLNELVKVIGG